MPRVDHHYPPAVAQRPKALVKKSRSPVSSPILACNFLIAASRLPSRRPGLPENTSTILSAAWRFHFVTRFGCTLCRAASVCSPRKASSATFAVKAAEDSVASPFLEILLVKVGSHLTQLSDSQGPPLSTCTSSIPKPGHGSQRRRPSADRRSGHDPLLEVLGHGFRRGVVGEVGEVAA